MFEILINYFSFIYLFLFKLYLSDRTPALKQNTQANKKKHITDHHSHNEKLFRANKSSGVRGNLSNPRSAVITSYYQGEKTSTNLVNSYMGLNYREREHWFGAHNPYRRVFPREVSPPKDCRPVNITGHKDL